MAQLRQDFIKFIQYETEILIIGPEDSKAFKDFFTRQCLPFTGLPDPEHKVLKLYGQEVNLFKLGRMPAQAIIDKQGYIRYIHYGHSMNDIPENQALFELLKEINSESYVVEKLVD